MKTLNSLAICLALSAAAPRAAAPQAPTARDPLLMMRVNGVELHYLDRGKGVPVVLVHAGLEDYRAWAPQMEALSRRHRTITYSRRFNHPNRNRVVGREYSATVDAADLAALIRKLNLAPAHVVGVSYGAYAALLLAAKHPNLVRSVVLTEPPLLPLLRKLDGGKPLFDEFMGKVWEPAARGFEEGDEEGIRRAVDGFGEIGYSGSNEKMTFASLPAEARSALIQNAAEWRALTASKNPFPDVSRGDIKDMKTPVLLLSGQRSLPMLALIDQELERLLPRAERVILPAATHEMWNEFPDQCRAAALAFFAKH
jgi:non-heme chloroperoxidase